MLAAPLISVVVSSCPGPRVLVTSRVLPHIPGEQRFLVSPLGLLDPATDAGAAESGVENWTAAAVLALGAGRV
ncbi:MAG: hypothetical protein WKF80_10290 [Thermomicrobiales bacterium]